MHALLGNRFLKWFAGDLKSRQKRWAILLKDQNPETELDMAVGPDSPASEKDGANQLSEDKDLKNEEGQNKKNETQNE